MIMDILAVIDGGTLDFRNRAINFDDGFIFMHADGGIPRPMIQHPARGTQVCQRMEVRGVPAGLGNNTPCAKQHEQQQMTMNDELALRVHCDLHPRRIFIIMGND